MDRAEATGVSVSLVGHLALLAALTLGFASAKLPPISNQPIEVSFVDEIGLESAAPRPATETPAQSMAPDVGAPEEAVPDTEPVPAPPEPAAKAEPQPAPKQAAAPPPKPAEKARPKQRDDEASAKATPTERKQSETKAAGKAKETRGSRLGKNFLKGLGLEETPSKSEAPTGAVMSAAAMTGIVAAIQRQIQPCADRQRDPGPGANRIVSEVNLKLNRDGSLAARPTIGKQTGIDDENERFKERVADLAIATFVGCSPLRELPVELYDVPNGWRSFTLRYRLPS